MVDQEQLRSKSPALLAILEAVADANFEGESDSCWDKVYASSSWVVVGVSYPPESGELYVALGTESEPACAATEHADSELFGSGLVTRRVSQGLYLGATNPALAARWLVDGNENRLARHLTTESEAAFRFAAREVDFLVPTLTDGHEAKGSIVHLLGQGFLEDGLVMRFDLEWSHTEDVQVAEKRVRAAITGMMEAAAYGDFARELVGGMSVSATGKSLLLQAAIHPPELKAILERLLFYDSVGVRVGTPAALFGALPVGIVKGEGIYTDRTIANSVRNAQEHDGFLAIVTAPGVTHERVTELVELLAPTKMPVFVSSEELPWKSLPLEELCLEKKNALACRNLGLALRDGLGGDVDLQRAQTMFTAGCKHGDVPSCDETGRVQGGVLRGTVGEGWSYGVVEGERPQSAMFLLRKAEAEKGDTNYMYEVGRMYAEGDGTSRDYTAAAQWYEKAAKAGHVSAQNNLAWLYEGGKGVDENHAEALRWYREAAKSGHTRAQVNLALMYHYGRGGPPDYSEAALWYRKAAAAGDVKAQTNLGKLYEKGLGVSKNPLTALRWYRRAGVQGYAEAQYRAARLYRLGLGTAKDDVAANRWYRKAAEQGHARAQYRLGRRYADGTGVEKDFQEAARWYRRAALQENDFAQLALARMYESGEGVEKNDETAIRWYQKAADNGHEVAQNLLGIRYDEGDGVVQDYAKALEWYSKSAEAGNEYAYVNIGILYAEGNGVEQDYQEAMRWFRKAAAAEVDLGLFYMGVLYTLGSGVKQDYQEAMRWYKKAAAKGSAQAKHNIGVCYEKGYGVTRDYSEAMKWFVAAAKDDIVSAEHAIGHLYEEGLGVKADDSKALEWYRRAARHGSADSQGRLGEYYLQGRVVEQDHVQAYAWLAIAVEGGNEQAKNSRDTAYAKLPASRRAEAKTALKALARELD